MPHYDFNRRNYRLFTKTAKNGAESALCSIMSTGPVDIYEVKRSKRHLLAAIENNILVSPIIALEKYIHFCCIFYGT